ncbi:solute carrier family 22 member 14 isoform X3 [Leopardus geoffroyi]|uniref:solute carrier family 22 member 14 isoform X3 n=1 Tax=Leopardus geoffroyi TaxID=46844 RepID=UPI001E260001|nr:solute carrier family 22 member 14 isoform X3 [Leopardus geoffroyi]
MSGESNCKVKHRSHHPSKNLNQHEAQEHSNSWSLEMLLRRLRATEANQDDKFAHVLDAVGEFGTFQRRLVVLTFIPNILLAFFISADVFVFTAQKPYCNTSWILAVGPNLTEAEQMNLTLPREPNGSFQTCLMYLPVAWDLDSIIQFGLNHTESCQDGWIYPDTKKRSLVNEFDLVCGKEQNSESTQTMFTAGILTGSLIFGLMSDKLGRYPTILMSLLGLIIFGFGTAFVSTFHQYLFFRFGVSQALVGYTISSVSLATEWLVAEHRSHAIILEHCFFSVGVMFLTGLANSLPHWRLLFLVGGAPVFPLIFYIWILPESPRWLLMNGKLEEAKQMLCYAAGVNKKTIPLSLLDKAPPKGDPGDGLCVVYCQLQLFYTVLQVEGFCHEHPLQTSDSWHHGGARPAVLHLSPRADREEVEPGCEPLPRHPDVPAYPYPPPRYGSPSPRQPPAFLLPQTPSSCPVRPTRHPGEPASCSHSSPTFLSWCQSLEPCPPRRRTPRPGAGSSQKPGRGGSAVPGPILVWESRWPSSGQIRWLHMNGGTQTGLQLVPPALPLICSF